MKNVNCPIAYRVKIISYDTSDKISHCIGKYIRGIINNAVSRNFNMEVKYPIYCDVLNNGWNNIEVLNINIDEEY
jgi:hypothetical protein